MLVFGAWPAAGAGAFVANSEDVVRIEQSLPRQAPARPTKPRRLLIFTLNVGYGGHPSIAYANEAFSLMGRKTGAFETVVSADPAVFARESLQQFDAVFFNNTVGNCFTNLEYRRNLAEFVMGGGGLMGVHGTTVAFTRWPGAVEDWPEFGFIIGARGANHKDSDEHVWLKLEEPDHPVTRVFGGQGFDYRDEFFRVHEPYSRSRLRVLLSIDTAKTDVNAGQPRGNTMRADNDYALAWIGSYGRGRIFYCTIAHNPRVFWDPKMLEFYLAAAQFALGDLPAPTTPSARLTPAVRAQEKFGWRSGLQLGASTKLSLFDAVDQTAQLGLSYLTASSGQLVSKEIPKKLDPRLADAERESVRLKLDAAGMRLLAYRVDEFPSDEPGCRDLFAFGRKMGVEVFIANPQPRDLERIGKLCDEYDIKLALHQCNAPATSPYARPEGVLGLCRGHSSHIGVAGCFACWNRAGLDPVRVAGTLKEHLFTVDLSELSGTAGSAAAESFLKEIRDLTLRPAIFTLRCPEDGGPESLKRLAESVACFNAGCIKAASQP